MLEILEEDNAVPQSWTHSPAPFPILDLGLDPDKELSSYYVSCPTLFMLVCFKVLVSHLQNHRVLD